MTMKSMTTRTTFGTIEPPPPSDELLNMSSGTFLPRQKALGILISQSQLALQILVFISFIHHDYA
jgi:hypothetical protein